MNKLPTINGNSMGDNIISMADPNWKKATAGNYEAAGLESARADFGYNSGARTFIGVTDSISIKSQYAQNDYNFYRANEMSPIGALQIIETCNRAYKLVGIIRNIIDLMGEFTCKGIRIVHPDKRAELFGQEWFKYVRGEHISERFSNNLYRSAQVAISTTFGKVPGEVTKEWSSSVGDIKVEEPKVVALRMPLKYTFLNPVTLEVIAPELSIFTGQPMYALRIGQSFSYALNKLGNITDAAINKIMETIPDDIKNAIKSNAKFIPLDNDSFAIYFYKKDDWEVWATPMIYSILPDVITLEKMKLADKSALDGAISNIRLWKIGHLSDNPQTCLIPTKAMINKLRGILANNVGGGTIDLVWGPDLDFKESNTQVHNFLGISKYEPIYKNIYEGLGVPSSMGGGGGDGFNSSFLQMQTLIERLEYGRSVLVSFWEGELKKVQLAMGYAKPFQIMFDQITLGDDSAVKNLLIGLVDRDIMSVDTLLDKFNCFSSIEIAKIKREYKARQKDNIPNKASPFHNPQSDEEMKKIILNQGGVAPSELGIDLQPKRPGEMSNLEKQAKLQPKQYAPSPPNGRPKNKKDAIKRKQRAVKPSTANADSFVSRFLWANAAQKKVSDIVTPELVQSFGKTDVRTLSTEEFERVEAAKFAILCGLEPYSDVTPQTLYPLLSCGTAVNVDMYHAVKTFVYKFSVDNDRTPNLEEVRQMQASAYSLYHEEDVDSDVEETCEEHDLPVLDTF